MWHGRIYGKLTRLKDIDLTEVSQNLSLEISGTSTSSDDSWSCALRWLDTCDRFHHSCSKLKDERERTRRYPTRLLDVGPLDEKRPTVKLIETSKSSPQGDYLTLSHCWGASQVIKLMSTNYEEFLVRVPELPRTFRHAITVARRLRIRYLWIDSLCIIQDSKQDWEKESSLMHTVYKHAHCNIAATASTGSNGGLFFERPRVRRHCNVFIPSTQNRYSLVDKDFWKKEVEESPLLSRGWVLQERLLAPRVLHFGRQQLFWECNEMNSCETQREGLPAAINQRSGKSQFHAQHMLRQDYQGPRAGQWLWVAVVQAYSVAHLTYASDKLVALSGIAKHVQALLQDEYVAGLWRGNFSHQLLWECRIPFSQLDFQHRFSTYRAPTWSWASVDGEVRLPNWIAERWQDMEDHMKILDVQITLSSDDPTGGVAGGSLLVQGPLSRVTLRGRELFHGETKVSGESHIDIASVRPDTEEFFILPIFECTLDEDRYLKLLFLKLFDDDQQSAQYVRCGVFDAYEEKEFRPLTRPADSPDTPCESFDPTGGHVFRIA
jgi:hypothetical protein